MVFPSVVSTAPRMIRLLTHWTISTSLNNRFYEGRIVYHRGHLLSLCLFFLRGVYL